MTLGALTDTEEASVGEGGSVGLYGGGTQEEEGWRELGDSRGRGCQSPVERRCSGTGRDLREPGELGLSGPPGEDSGQEPSGQDGALEM